MPTNDFPLFATGAGSNTLTNAEYVAMASRALGFQAGTALSEEVNTALRKPNIMASMLAQFIVDFSGRDAVDDGTVATLEANLALAIQGVTTKESIHYAADTGTANAYAAAYDPVIIQPYSGQTLYFLSANANTGASTFSPNGFTPAPIIGQGGQPLQGGEIAASGVLVGLTWQSGSWNLVCSRGNVQTADGSQSHHAASYGQLQSVSTAISNEATARANADTALSNAYQQADTNITQAYQQADATETARATQAESALNDAIALRATSSFTSGVSFLIGDIRVLIGSGTLPNSGANTSSVAITYSGFSAIPVVLPIAEAIAITSGGFNAVLAVTAKTNTGATVNADINEAQGFTINRTIPFSYIAIGKTS